MWLLSLKNHLIKAMEYSNTDPYFTEDGISKSDLVLSETDVSGSSTTSIVRYFCLWN